MAFFVWGVCYEARAYPCLAWSRGSLIERRWSGSIGPSVVKYTVFFTKLNSRRLHRVSVVCLSVRGTESEGRAHLLGKMPGRAL